MGNLMHRISMVTGTQATGPTIWAFVLLLLGIMALLTFPWVLGDWGVVLGLGIFLSLGFGPMIIAEEG